jgi:RNA recognition motif-containing protein
VTTIYVGNLPIDARAETLRIIFSRYGRVAAIELIRDRQRTRRSRSYGLVDMPRRAEAHNAVQELNGQYFRGMFLRVRPARMDPEVDA